MIILDTHIWRWLVTDDPRLTAAQRQIIQERHSEPLGVSAISLWEIAKAVEVGRLLFTVPVAQWLEDAVRYPRVEVIALTPRIAAESTMLPPPIHRDPGDQIIIATARVYDADLLTADERIRQYPDVRLA